MHAQNNQQSQKVNMKSVNVSQLSSKILSHEDNKTTEVSLLFFWKYQMSHLVY